MTVENVENVGHTKKNREKDTQHTADRKMKIFLLNFYILWNTCMWTK